MVKFARVTPDHLAMIENSLPKPVSLYLYALLWSKPADSLDGWAALRFEEWREASGFAGIAAKEFRAVDFTEGQAMEWLTISSKRAAGKALADALSSGLLVRVAPGVKRHPSLYLVAPLPCNEYAPTIPNNLGEQEEQDTPPLLAVAPPKEEQYAPTSPNKSCCTYKSLHKITNEAQAAYAQDGAPPVRVGDRCPVCHRSKVATIDAIMRERGTTPKKELRGELRCPNCWASWLKDGSFKKYGKALPPPMAS